MTKSVIVLRWNHLLDDSSEHLAIRWQQPGSATVLLAGSSHQTLNSVHHVLQTVINVVSLKRASAEIKVQLYLNPIGPVNRNPRLPNAYSAAACITSRQAPGGEEMYLGSRKCTLRRFFDNLMPAYTSNL